MFHSEAAIFRKHGGALFSGVDLEVDVDLGAVVELADGLGVALVIVELGVDFVVHVRKAGEAVGAVLSHDYRFSRRACAYW